MVQTLKMCIELYSVLSEHSITNYRPCGGMVDSVDSKSILELGAGSSPAKGNLFLFLYPYSLPPSL